MLHISEKELLQGLEAEIKKERIAQMEKTFKKMRSKAQKKYKLTDEAMTRLETIMVERSIGDYKVAMSYMSPNN